MARDEPKHQVVQLNRRHPGWLITAPVASDRKHLKTTALHLPDQFILGLSWTHHERPVTARMAILRRCIGVSGRIRLRKALKEAQIPFRPAGKQCQSYPILLAHVPHRRDPSRVQSHLTVSRRPQYVFWSTALVIPAFRHFNDDERRHYY